MKILVTGASGLLGTDIVLNLSSSGYEIIKNSFSLRPGFVAADIRTKEGLETLISQDWDTIIHTSAARDPDSCEQNKEETYKLNVESVRELAKAAALRKAKFVFISTDYVFSGDNPPYCEVDEPNPINYYGETKLEAEKILESLCPDSIILRVSLLYGINAGIKASPLLYSSLKAIESKSELQIDDAIVRYPLYTGDVADAIKFLIKRNASGIFHLSSEDKTTKYQIARDIADIIGRSSEHIKPLQAIPPTPAKRPVDSHLNSNKLFATGFPALIPFKERITLMKEKLVSG